MSVINSQPLIGASGNQSTAYNLTRSLRFRSGASAYLNRTPSSTTNQRTFTWSGWVKRGRLGGSAEQYLFSARSANNDSGWFSFYFGTGDTLNVGGWSQNYRATTQVFRDPSAWYHIILAVDTTQATASNRVKVYVNGSEITTFSTSNNPTQNFDYPVNSSSAAHGIGDVIGYSANYYLDGYMAEVNFVDGQALTPSDFGETDTATGVWKPKKYTGTYGTNGFYLDFEDTTSTTTLGYDAAGSNDWTVNNISLTSGATYDSMKDVPTLTDADTANYAVLNPLNPFGTISDGNLLFQSSAGVTRVGAATTTILSGSKTYFEATLTTIGSTGTYFQLGLIPLGKSFTSDIGVSASNGYSIEDNQGSDIRLRLNGSSVTIATAAANGNTFQVAIDQSTGKLWLGRNNTWYNSTGGTDGDPAAGTNETATISTTTEWYPAVAKYATGGSYSVNFGQRPFAYTPPSGFKALNTFNLPTPTIGATASTQANDYFDATTYTGNGSTQSITNSGSFQPDFVWIKNRTSALDHRLVDAVRGTTKEVYSSTTGTEGTDANGLTAFNLNGFSVGSSASYNGNTNSLVAWQWKANGAGSSNTSGSISSTVSANTTAGFSIVTYTGNATAGATVGHGLGVAPNMIIIKSRGAVTSWPVYHSSLGATSWILLNSTSAATTSSQEFNNTAPTSSVFSIGNASSNSNQSATYVAYCFAEVAGYSAFGSYTGNGSTDGTFIYTGFRPKLIITKASSTTGNWNIIDTARNTTNVIGELLYADASDAGATYTLADSLSNGFKLRNSGGNINNSGTTFIYIAFAENPFKYSLAR
jgi:hypothetical protein